MKAKILFVDDDPAFLRAVEFALADDFDLDLCSTYESAQKKLETTKYELLILDYDLGLHSAEDLLQKNQSKAPILIVTGKAEKHMAIRLLNLRINGLIEKPVTAKALQAKIREILNNNQTASNEGTPISSLSITYFQNRRLVIYKNQEISLTPIENKILENLLEHKNQVVKRTDLCDAIWGQTTHAKNVLDTHLYNLKRKIPALEKNLKTVYGDGLVLDI